MTGTTLGGEYRRRDLKQSQEASLELAPGIAEQRDLPQASRWWEHGLRVRFHIIRNARIENVGKSQSCMVSKLRFIWKQTVETYR